MIYRAPAAKSNSKKQFPGTIDISGLRDAVKTVFFLQNQFSVDRSRVLQILTCNLQITPSAKKNAVSNRGFLPQRTAEGSVSSSHNTNNDNKGHDNNALDRNLPTMSEVCDTPITNNQVIKVVETVRLSKSTLSPDEDLQCAVETS